MAYSYKAFPLPRLVALASTNPQNFLEVHVRDASTSTIATHKPPISAFGQVITSNKIMSNLFDLAFDQVNKDPKRFSSNPDYRVQDLDHLLNALDTVIDQPPKYFNVKNEHGVTIGEPVAMPIYLILDLLSNTSAVYDLFRMKEFNDAMKKLLNTWWYGEASMDMLESGLGKWSFQDTYKADPDTGGYQYKSWDRFFTRELNETVHGQPLRPILFPGALPLIYNACESTVLRTATNVQLHDMFWLKSQNYSLFDMLGGKDYPQLPSLAKDFVGGSVYQAYLSSADYHRWHSPIRGRVTKTQLLDGAYFAVLPDDGAPPHDTDLEPGDLHSTMNRCQPWLAISAARAVLIIKPICSLLPVEKICFIAVGMGEVSTSEITVKEGTEVDIGGQLGMFHFGGSAYVLVIKPKESHEVIFEDLNEIPMRSGQHRWINPVIGQIRKKGGK